MHPPFAEAGAGGTPDRPILWTEEKGEAVASTGDSDFGPVDWGPIDFGGLCFNGHDVPRGARYCPQCGTPATAPSGAGAPLAPPASWPPQPVAAHRYPAPGYGHPAPGYGWAGPWARRRLNPAAVVAVVLSLVWFYGLASVTAVVLGHVSLRQIDRSGDRGRGLAVTALVIGYLGLVMTVVFLTLLAARA